MPVSSSFAIIIKPSPFYEERKQSDINMGLFMHKIWRYHELLLTRMHSSRMRTFRCSGRPWGGVCLGGVCLPATPPWTEWQAHVKTLPCHNYVADGNKHIVLKSRLKAKVQVLQILNLNSNPPHPPPSILYLHSELNTRFLAWNFYVSNTNFCVQLKQNFTVILALEANIVDCFIPHLAVKAATEAHLW